MNIEGLFADTIGSFPWKKIKERKVCCDPKTHIKVQDLSLSYGGVKAFEKINLDISKGCITAIVGPSGCGKSSFLLTLNRLHESVPGAKLEGDIFFEGQSIFSPNSNLRKIRQQISIVFQKPTPFPISIKRNLTLPLKENGVSSVTEQNDRIEKVLKEIGIWNEVSHRLDDSALSLSGGQQQRLCIARALMLEPKVMLMDEPCSALDPISSGVLEDLISGLRGKVTVVVVTHNLAQARRISDWTGVFWVKDSIGQLIEYDSAASIFESPKNPITQSYIGGIRG